MEDGSKSLTHIRALLYVLEPCASPQHITPAHGHARIVLFAIMAPQQSPDFKFPPENLDRKREADIGSMWRISRVQRQTGRGRTLVLSISSRLFRLRSSVSFLDLAKTCSELFFYFFHFSYV